VPIAWKLGSLIFLEPWGPVQRWLIFVSKTYWNTLWVDISITSEVNLFWVCNLHSCTCRWHAEVMNLFRSYRVSCSAHPYLPPPNPFPKQTSKHWPRVFETRYEYIALACDPISAVLKSLQAVLVYRLIITLHCGHALNMYGDHLSPFGVSTSVDLEIPDYLFIYTSVCLQMV
jgi:hypothetical protein